MVGLSKCTQFAHINTCHLNHVSSHVAISSPFLRDYVFSFWHDHAFFLLLNISKKHISPPKTLQKHTNTHLALLATTTMCLESSTPRTLIGGAIATLQPRQDISSSALDRLTAYKLHLRNDTNSSSQPRTIATLISPTFLKQRPSLENYRVVIQYVFSSLHILDFVFTRHNHFPQ